MQLYVMVMVNWSFILGACVCAHSTGTAGTVRVFMYIKSHYIALMSKKRAIIDQHINVIVWHRDGNQCGVCGRLD